MTELRFRKSFLKKTSNNTIALGSVGSLNTCKNKRYDSPSIGNFKSGLALYYMNKTWTSVPVKAYYNSHEMMLANYDNNNKSTYKSVATFKPYEIKHDFLSRLPSTQKALHTVVSSSPLRVSLYLCGLFPTPPTRPHKRSSLGLTRGGSRPRRPHSRRRKGLLVHGVNDKDEGDGAEWQEWSGSL